MVVDAGMGVLGTGGEVEVEAGRRTGGWDGTVGLCEVGAG